MVNKRKIKEVKGLDNQICQICNKFDNVIVNVKQNFLYNGYSYRKVCFQCIHKYKISVGNYLKSLIFHEKKKKIKGVV